MSAESSKSDTTRATLAAMFMLTWALAAHAVEPSRAKPLRVTVFPDAYLAAGQRFSTLDALDAWLKKKGPQVLQLDACGAAANGQLLQAAARFHTMYLDLRTMPGGAPGCRREATSKMPRAEQAALRPSETDSASQLYWRGVMP